MKKALFIISMTILVTLTNKEARSQSTYRLALQKGSVLLDGSLALSLGKAKSEYSSTFGSGESEASYNSITLSPQASFFLLNGFAMGLTVDLTTLSYKEDDDKATITQFLLGPAIKYYTPGGFFFQGNMTFGKSKTKYSDEPEPDDGTNVSKWQLGAGYAIFLNNHISLEPGVMYRSTTHKSKMDTYKSSDKLGELVLGVGLNIFIHKKSE